MTEARSKEEKVMSDEKIPYKIYLSEEEMPRDWYNVRADHLYHIHLAVQIQICARHGERRSPLPRTGLRGGRI